MEPCLINVSVACHKLNVSSQVEHGKCSLCCPEYKAFDVCVITGQRHRCARTAVRPKAVVRKQKLVNASIGESIHNDEQRQKPHVPVGVHLRCTDFPEKTGRGVECLHHARSPPDPQSLLKSRERQRDSRASKGALAYLPEQSDARRVLSRGGETRASGGSRGNGGVRGGEG